MGFKGAMPSIPEELRQRGFKGERGLDGLGGPIGPVGSMGDPGLDGLEGIPGRQGQSGLPGLNGEPGAQGHFGDAGIDGYEGVLGQPGPQGFAGSEGQHGQLASSRGFYFARHSQTTSIPQCPPGTDLMWSGYSLLHIQGNKRAHGQDLGQFIKFSFYETFFAILIT